MAMRRLEDMNHREHRRESGRLVRQVDRPGHDGRTNRTDLDHVRALTQAKGSPIQRLEVDSFAAARLACEGRYAEAQQTAAEAEDLFRRTARRSDAAVLFGSKLMSFVDR